MAQTVELKVGMSCQGCVGAVKRVLGKMEGVESFDIDIEKQKVIVKGNVEPEAVLQIVSKTGKKTSFWEEEPTAKEPAATEPEPVKEPTAEPETAKESMAEPETKPTEAVVIA